MSRANPSNPSNDNGVLIVGAGPTGSLPHDRELFVRIVDKSAGPSTTSRAQIVNPRLLELFEIIGAIDAIVAESHSLPIGSVRRYEHWPPLAEIDFGTIEPTFRRCVTPQETTQAQAVRPFWEVNDDRT
jgi:2-polyprenyl-6-methoxyphenol hydroxylase-like FAD-dependent oxidoreductase